MGNKGCINTSLVNNALSQFVVLSYGSPRKAIHHFFFLIGIYPTLMGLPWWLSGKESTCQCRRYGLDPWVGKIPWRRKWQLTPVFLPGESHGRRSMGSQRVGRNFSFFLFFLSFFHGSMVKNPPANAGDMGLIPGSGRLPGERNDSLFQ